MQRKVFRKYMSGVLLIVTVLALATYARPPQAQNLLLPENATMKVSDHVYVIMGFPNVGIVVGNHRHAGGWGNSARTRNIRSCWPG